MPFFDDTGAEDEALARPIWGVFALLRENLERVMLANIGWALQLFPVFGALAFPQLPLALRIVMVFYSLTALAPATALLYVWMARVAQGEMLRLETFKDDLREFALPGLLRLAPLFGFLGLSYLLIILLSFAHILLLDTLARFLLMILLVCALYWGPLFAEFPGRSIFFLLRQSLLLVWRYPGQTLLTGLVVLLATVLGLITIVPFFVIVPVVVVLLQTRRCLELLAREKMRQARRSGVKVGVI
jgi:hypothetical protein